MLYPTELRGRAGAAIAGDPAACNRLTVSACKIAADAPVSPAIRQAVLGASATVSLGRGGWGGVGSTVTG